MKEKGSRKREPVMDNKNLSKLELSDIVLQEKNIEDLKIEVLNNIHQTLWEIINKAKWFEELNKNTENKKDL